MGFQAKPPRPDHACNCFASSSYAYLYPSGATPGKCRCLGAAVACDTVRAPDMLAFMRKLRQIFSKNPELGKILREMLANEKNLDIPSMDHPRVQALIELYEGDDQRYLNFYGPPGSITTIPYYLVADNQKSDSGIKMPDMTGKVVFVGFSDLYDPGQPDRFYTVFTNDDGVDLSGVEIAATSFGNLLTDKSLHPPEYSEKSSL